MAGCWLLNKQHGFGVVRALVTVRIAVVDCEELRRSVCGYDVAVLWW